MPNAKKATNGTSWVASNCRKKPRVNQMLSGNRSRLANEPAAVSRPVRASALETLLEDVASTTRPTPRQRATVAATSANTAKKTKSSEMNQYTVWLDWLLGRKLSPVWKLAR